MMNLAASGYKFIPKVNSLVNTTINMQRIPGMTLDKYIISNPTTGVYISLLESIMVASRDMMDVKVLHLDLAPVNIIFGDDGNIWILDFGLARLIRELEPFEGRYSDTILNYVRVMNGHLFGAGLFHIVPEKYAHI